MVICKNFINGKWVAGARDATFESRNPTHPDEIIGIYPKSNKDDVGEAVDAACRAFKPWRDLGMVKRAQYLKEFFWLMEKVYFDSLVALVVCEAGKQFNEARADVIEAIHMAEYAYSVGTMGRRGEIIDLEVSAKDAFSKLVPRGVAVAITPWNFPIAIPLWEIALTLVYGNTVIFKPSEDTPACGEAIAKLVEEAHFPPGVFNLVQGDGSTGEQLVHHPDTDVIIFTGSWEVGNAIKQGVAQYPHKICTIETGSKSAVIVLDDALDTIAIPAGILSAFKTAGQRCVSASRIIVHRKKLDAYLDQFVENARRIKVGNPFDPESFYGPMINESALTKGFDFNKTVATFTDVLLDRHQEPLPTENGYWLRPFVCFTEWPEKWGAPHTPLATLREEPFAPHVAIIPADGLEHAVHIYNDTPYGLSAAVITEDYRKARFAEDNLECGLFYWNLPCIGADVRQPFGGVKQSGNLTPSAAGLVPVLTHQKAVTYNRSQEIIMAQGLSAKV